MLRTFVSIGFSFFILSLMLKLVSTGIDPANRPQIFTVLGNTSFGLASIYVVCALLQAFFRAIRYRVLIKAGGDANTPTLFHTYLVTLVRNMFVDMLPARIGELSYIAMMNRGFRVSGQTCLSSLSVSFVFDLVALFIIIAVVIVYHTITASVRGWLITAAIALCILTALILIFLFFGIEFMVGQFHRIPQSWRKSEKAVIQRLLTFTEHFAQALRMTRNAGVFSITLLLSMAVRITKYTSIYLLFLAVVRPSFNEFADLPVINIFTALLSAEGAASLPVPAFMSFGTYEAGGALALVLLGFAKPQSVITMLCIHILSQLADYTLGCVGFVIFLFVTQGQKATVTMKSGRIKKYLPTAITITVLCIGLVLLGLQYRVTRKIGALKPPHKGQPLNPTDAEQRRLVLLTQNLKGFIVWSSNRFGNHDILIMPLGSGKKLKIRQLTKHPHVDYFARVSPDGQKIVFSRSQQPWVSQRNCFPWDVYMLDLKSGKERFIAKNGNTPTWSEDGASIYFQKNGNQFVSYNLATGKEQVIFGPGINGLTANIMLQTPSYSTTKQTMAVTMRQGRRGTALFAKNGENRIIADGCQLAWAPDSSYLYYTDHGGRQQNAFYKVDPLSLERKMWLDLAGDYSHEYFPKVSDNMQYLVLGASSGGHEHDTADYEIFIWKTDASSEDAVRVTFHTGNDCWPDVYLQ